VRPGEFSLAHNGVLFLDEFCEFDRRALEVLREPMEEKVIHLTRAGRAVSFPADFTCVAAMNPCPCGFSGLGDGRCSCTPQRIATYRNRISGPLLDRFDMRLFLRPVPAEHLFSEEAAEASHVIRERVLRARAVQERRRRGEIRYLNGCLPDRKIRSIAGYGPPERTFLLRLVAVHRLTARAARRLERVARTIADLADEEHVREIHLMESLGFRLGSDLEEATARHGTPLTGGSAAPPSRKHD
jgi:magnesium chelatase family protein